MTRNQLCKEIAKREGKKSPISIGNVREVVRIIIQMEFDAVVFGNDNGSPVDTIVKESLKKIGNKAD